MAYQPYAALGVSHIGALYVPDVHWDCRMKDGNVTWTPKVCITIAFWALFGSFRQGRYSTSFSGPGSESFVDLGGLKDSDHKNARAQEYRLSDMYEPRPSSLQKGRSGTPSGNPTVSQRCGTWDSDASCAIVVFLVGCRLFLVESRGQTHVAPSQFLLQQRQF